MKFPIVRKSVIAVQKAIQQRRRETQLKERKNEVNLTK